MFSFFKGRRWRPETTHQKHLVCLVELLDGDQMSVPLSKKSSLGQELLDKVLARLDIEEKDYFGLHYLDAVSQTGRWLEPEKQVRKQADHFSFRVKFYSSEPNQLRDEFTRYLLFLQLKSDLASGRLPCPAADMAAQLTALALQSEFGDFDEQLHTPHFVSQFRFIADQRAEGSEAAVLAQYRLCSGFNPAQAELRFLNKAKQLDKYGVDCHDVTGKDGSHYVIGIAPAGLLIYEGDMRIGLFLWPKMLKMDFKGNRLVLVVLDEEQHHTFLFHVADARICKQLWKRAVEHHAFFRLREPIAKPAAKSGFFRLGSRFRYSGRTEYQSILEHSMSRTPRRRTQFERRSSRRYEPRPMGLRH